MLLIYGNQELWESFPADEFADLIRATDAQHVELRARPASSSARTASPTK